MLSTLGGSFFITCKVCLYLILCHWDSAGLYYDMSANSKVSALTISCTSGVDKDAYSVVAIMLMACPSTTLSEET